MTWWQSLLIAMIPAVLTGFISWYVSYQKIKNTKREIEDKYKAEDKLYKTKVRFDTEFFIYKELSQKVMTMVMDNVNLFPQGLYYEPLGKEEKEKYHLEIYKICQESFKEANSSIAQYAVFIPEDWFNKFVEIRNLCRLQIRYYFEFRIKDSSSTFDETIRECFNRTKEIDDKVNILIKDLRKYIETLDVKEEANNGD